MKIGPINISLSGKRHRRRNMRAAAGGRRRNYTAAGSEGYNSAHWAGVNGGDVNMDIRRSLAVLRNRCRYEIRNNAWAAGAANIFADSIVGSGPKLQVLSTDAEFNRSVEEKFAEWAEQCDMRARMTLGQLLHLAGGLQQCDSGEGFIVFHQRKDDDYPVKLKLLAIEGDR